MFYKVCKGNIKEFIFLFFFRKYQEIQNPSSPFVRSSHPEVFCKISVLKNFTKFTGKHLCQSLLFNKVAGLRPATLLKKKLCNRCFPANFVKFLRTHFYIERLWWLLLTNHMCLNVNNSMRTK